MFPLLYVPPLLGLARLDAKTVAAVVITQVFFEPSRRLGPPSEWPRPWANRACRRDDIGRRLFCRRSGVKMDT